jgi:phthiocerol/phenolphthiocerol synthesis type-I polyketide synthase D
MQDELNQAETGFFVVTNKEGRFALWPAYRSLPRGWQRVYGMASRSECLQFVQRTNSVGETAPRISRTAPMQFSLMFFGDSEECLAGDKYGLVMQSAKYADRHGLTAIWLPERHFTRFGCLFPSPAVLHAALARETTDIRLRAGSSDAAKRPIRVAEQWAMVDNLSGGRVDLAFASGWVPNDFALRPDAYEDRSALMYRGIEQVRKLWRCQRIRLTNGAGEQIEVRIYPTPIQDELPVWITAATKLDTFVRAGKLGMNVLTHLFDQRVDDLADKIHQYRQSRQSHGSNPNDGHVTVALHTFVGRTISEVRKHAEQPYCHYLKTNFPLLNSLAFSRGIDLDEAKLEGHQLDELVHYIFEKFLGGRSLLGTPETCSELVDQLAHIGVNEIACLVDFGPSTEAILANLRYVTELAERMPA